MDRKKAAESGGKTAEPVDRSVRFSHRYPNLTTSIRQTDGFFELQQNADLENMSSFILDAREFEL
jgi:hypothetical protein